MTDPKQALVRIDPQMLLTKAVEGNASIETLERLVALAKDVREVQAKEAYHTAMASFQQRCPVIDKSSKANIYTSRGSYTYSYAPLDKIMVAIRPLLAELGLTVTWTSREETNRVVARCRVSHVLGYSEDSGDVSMPIPDPSERGGGNPAQRSGSALTYAKRYSLLNVTGITPEDDDDARSAGTPPKDVTPPPPVDPPPLKDVTPPQAEDPPLLTVDEWKDAFNGSMTKATLQAEWNKFYALKGKYEQEEYVAVLMAKDARKSELS